MSGQLIIREANAADIPAIRLLIQEFAEFEQLSDSCEVTEADLEKAIFDEQNFVQALVAMEANRYAGYALFFPVFKSFRGERGYFVEDLYVTPDLRGLGLGLAMLREIARRAAERNFTRLDWQALKWNEAAINFYKKLGAETDDENFDFRLRGAAFYELSK